MAMLTSETGTNKIQDLLNNEYSSIKVSKATIKRLDSKGKYRDSYETIINHILDEKEGKEVNSQERSF